MRLQKAIFPVCRAFLVLLITCPCSLHAQHLTLQFDTSARLVTFPFSSPFTKYGPRILANTDDLSVGIRMKIKDSLLARAGDMDKTLKDPKIMDFYKTIWGAVKVTALQKELNDWTDYLNKFDPTSTVVKKFAFFPAVPLASEMNFYFYSDLHGKKINIDGGYLSAQDNDPDWITEGLNPQLRFRLIWDNAMKKTLLDKYSSLPQVAQDLTLEQIGNWPDSLQYLLAAITRVDQVITPFMDLPCHPGLNKEIVDSLNKWVSIAQLVNDKIKVQYKIWKCVQDNPPFFMYWLWYNKGIPTFNPFSFTSPENYIVGRFKKDSLNESSADIFNNKVEEAVNLSPNHKFNKDSLIALLKVRQTGGQLFGPADSAQAVADNMAAYNKFRKEFASLYSFTYPYRMDDDSAIFVRQFDAANHYKPVDALQEATISFRCRNKPPKNIEADRMNMSPRAIDHVMSNMPDNQRPMIASHNSPLGARTVILEKASSVKDESAFTQLIDTTLTAASSLYNLQLGSLISATVKSQTAKNIISAGGATSNFEELATANSSLMSVQMTLKVAIIPPPSAPIAPSSVTVDVQGKPVTFHVLGNVILDCGKTLRAILKIALNGNSTLCDDTLFNQYLRIYKPEEKKYCTYSDSATFKTNADALIAHFTSFLKMLNQDEQEIKAFINAEKGNIAVLQNLGKLKHLQVPPPVKLALDPVPPADTGVYRTEITLPQQSGSLNQDSYTLVRIIGKDSTKMAAGTIRLAPRHWFTLGLGVEWTPNKLPLPSISTAANGRVSTGEDIQNIRVIAGLHIYPWRLFNLDNRFFIHRSVGSTTWSRLSIFLGTGIPDPLHNYYTGIGVDIVPGLKLQAGAHWLWYTKYTILNNQLENQTSGPKAGGLYLALTIEPIAAVTNFISSFK